MYSTDDYICFSMPELFNECSEAEINDKISSFKCKKSNEVQNFLINDSIEFTKKHQAITYLIAQLGKNENAKININEIFQIINYYIDGFQNGCGGVVEFLEAKNSEKLLEMYKNIGFKIFNIRTSNSCEDNKLIQMYRLI